MIETSCWKRWDFFQTTNQLINFVSRSKPDYFSIQIYHVFFTENLNLASVLSIIDAFFMEKA